MLPKTPQLAIIACEIALCNAISSFPPRVIHTPGVAHKVADMLSRVAQHASIGKAAESHKVRVQAPLWDESFYNTLHAYSDAS